MDFSEIATLMHLEEKLRGHPHLASLYAHVQAELKRHNAVSTHEELPEIPLTKREEEARAKAEADREAAEAAAGEDEEEEDAA